MNEQRTADSNARRKHLERYATMSAEDAAELDEAIRAQRRIDEDARDTSSASPG